MAETSATFNLADAFERVHERLDGIKDQLSEAKSHLAKVDTHLGGLLGNGQPGRIKSIENAVAQLKEERDVTKGYIKGAAAIMGAAAVVLSALVNWLINLWMKVKP